MPANRKVKVLLLENGRPVESAVACTWTNFLNGHWTKDRPTRQGKFMIANKAGRVVGEVFVFFDLEVDDLCVRVRDGALCKLHEMTEKDIWWWSEAVPLYMPVSPPRAWSDGLSQEDMWGTKEEVAARKRCMDLRDQGLLTPDGEPRLMVVESPSHDIAANRCPPGGAAQKRELVN